jgi:hypothetical protein
MTVSTSFVGVMVNNPIPNPLKLVNWHQILFLGKGWTGGATPASSTQGPPGLTFQVDISFPAVKLPTKLQGTIEITGGPAISFNIIANVDAAGNISGKLAQSSIWNGKKISGSVTGSFTKTGSIIITSTDPITIPSEHLLQPVTGSVALTTQTTTQQKTSVKPNKKPTKKITSTEKKKLTQKPKRHKKKKWDE